MLNKWIMIVLTKIVVIILKTSEKYRDIICAKFQKHTRNEKSSKKVLTRGNKSGKIFELSQRGGCRREVPRYLEKNSKEILKKVLTKGKRCGIIVKLSARNSERSLKIEQQERSTKHSMCERTNLVKELYILNKVKEAKINSSKDCNRRKAL